MSWLGPIVLAASVVFALAAVWTDVRRREIPHATVGGLVAFWVVAAAFEPRALNATPLAALVCGAVALALGFAFHAAGWLGGGDGKLLAALALWLGPADIGLALVATGVLGLLMALAAHLRRDAEWHREGIPYAVAIAPPAAAVLAFRAVA